MSAIKPSRIELVEAEDAGQGLICIVKVVMPDGRNFKLICTWPEYESLLSEGIES